MSAPGGASTPQGPDTTYLGGHAVIDDTRPKPSPSPVLYLTAADRQDAARQTYQDHLDRGVQLTGMALGDLFDRSGRWGNDRIAEVLRDHSPHRNGSTVDRDPASHCEPAPARQLPVTPAVRRITTLAVLAVAAVAAIASYDHQRQLAELAGEGWRAWLLPVSVDGLIVAASMTLLVRRRTNQPAGVLPWGALLLGGTASVIANVAAADPTLAGRLVAAWPPIALLISYELFLTTSHQAGAKEGNVGMDIGH
jgi:hypothetical protein